MRRLVPKSIFYSVLPNVPSSHTLPLTLILLSTIGNDNDDDDDDSLLRDQRRERLEILLVRR